MPNVFDQGDDIALVKYDFLEANKKKKNRNNLMIYGTHLPREIIVLLATYLNLKDVIALSQVNYATHRAINDPKNNLKAYIPTINTTVSYHKMLDHLKNGFPEVDKLDALTKKKHRADVIVRDTTTVTMNDIRNNNLCDQQFICSNSIITASCLMTALTAAIGIHAKLLPVKMASTAMGISAAGGVCAGATAFGIFKCVNKLAASRSAKLENEIGNKPHLLHTDRLIKTRIDSGKTKEMLESSIVYIDKEIPNLVTMR